MENVQSMGSRFELTDIKSKAERVLNVELCSFLSLHLNPFGLRLHVGPAFSQKRCCFKVIAANVAYYNVLSPNFWGNGRGWGGKTF